jgi:hypothetical protein
MVDRSRRFIPIAALAVVIALAGCASSPGSPTDNPPAAPTDALPSGGGPDDTSTPSAGPASPAASLAPEASATPPAIVLDQEWATAPLLDVATGETFRIADHAGTVIMLETMAIWCSKCLAQQRDVRTALQELPLESITYVVLDVDPNEDAESLAGYREHQGFEGRYAIAGADVARGLAATFGDQVLNPPSTPIVFIGTDGRVTLTTFGHKSPDDLVALAREHGA